MDSPAVSYSAELARFGIDTAIVVPGSCTVGTNHFVDAGHVGIRRSRGAADSHAARGIGDWMSG